MPLPVRIAGVVAVTAALIVLPAGLASAGPAAAKSSDVIRALALPAQPTDFVVMVDASTSMAKGKRPSAVRSEVVELLKIMEPTDRLALFTYGSSVTARYRGLVGDQASGVLANLPEATGRWSDQGAALEAGVNELAREGANPQAVVVLITDGRTDPGPGSDYQSELGKAWADLIENGNRLARQRPVLSYGLGLSSAADAQMLTQVFPGARAVKASSAAKQIKAIRDDLERARASRFLAAELASPITMSWSGDFADGSSGWLPIRVSLESNYSHVPVSVSKLTVRATGATITGMRGLPGVIDLAPGETKQLDAQIQLRGDGDLTNLALSFSGAVDSPWRQVLTSSLGLAFEPKLVTVSAAPGRGTLERSVPTLLTVGGLLGLSVLVWWLGTALLSPRMRGELIFSRHAQEVSRVKLRGRRQGLGGVPGSGALSALAGTVYGARPIRGGEREVRVDLMAGSNWSRAVIHDGHVIQMGDIEIAYSSEPGAIVRPALVH